MRFPLVSSSSPPALGTAAAQSWRVGSGGHRSPWPRATGAGTARSWPVQGSGGTGI